MATATSTTTMPTSRGVKSSFGGLPPIAILPSRPYPAARPGTTALWYSTLTSILPSVAGVRVVLGWAYRGLTGGFLLLQNFSVAISVSPHVCFILVLILISMFLR